MIQQDDAPGFSFGGGESPGMRSWFVLRSRPRREHSVCAYLLGRAIEAYFPLLRRRRARRPVVVEPLFPNYLFVRLRLGTEEVAIARSCPGASYLLGAPGQPIAVPDELVAQIRAREAAGPVGFRPGQRVVITSGPFRDLEAIFDAQLSASGRVRVLLQLVGRLVGVELTEDMLRRAV